MVKEILLQKPKYISPCHAASLFGIITADGKVYLVRFWKISYSET